MTDRPRVLVVDDDPALRYTLREILETAGVSVAEAADGVEALAAVAELDPTLVVTDLRMPRMDGAELLRRLVARQRPPRVVVITAHGSERQAVEAMKAGAWDYFRKPFDSDELLAVIRRALEASRLAEENARLAAEVPLARRLVFESESMRQLARLVARVAPHDVTVLITGESGTGKERVAESLVEASGRAGRAFVRFNCASLPADLADAELFGHARGAFTGALRARPGLFREAHGGTLLLDEVGELDPGVQAKLLRVLQEGEVRAVGEDRPVKVDVRILAATHRSLEDAVAKGRFREDLYYRLKVVELQVPPLRQRPEDLAPLARFFLQRAAERFGLPLRAVPETLFARLAEHPWPGNVRELENAMESMVVLSSGGDLDLSLLPGPRSGSTPATLRSRVEAYERRLIRDALREAGGARSEAARRLGISRTTLHEKLHRYGLAGDDAEPSSP